MAQRPVPFGTLAPFDFEQQWKANQLRRAAPLAPGATGELTNYAPSWRDRMADVFGNVANAISGKDYSEARRDSMTLMGLSPGIGTAMSAEDAVSAAKKGDYVGAGLNSLGFIPDGGTAAKAIFAGIVAKTADRAMLGTAEKMAAKGADKASIWDATGWFKGPDDKWRFEIDDSASKLTPKAADELMAGGGGTYGSTQRTAPGVLQHGALYGAYPEQRAIDVDARHNVKLSQGNVKGSYGGTAVGYGERPQVSVQSNSLEGDPRSVRGILLHELQHDVQAREEFASGGNNISVFGHSDPAVRGAVSEEMDKLLRTLPFDEYAGGLRQSWPEATEMDLRNSYNEYLKANKDARSNVYHPANKAAQETAAMSVYKRMAGEVEARNVQTRMNMTPEQRRAIAPWLTQDTPFEQQIVRKR